MKTILLALLCGTIVGSAQAADLPLLKAQPTGFPAAGSSGWYVGLGASAEVARSSVATDTFGTSLYSAGANIEAALGYQFKFGSGWGAFEADFNYTNLGNTVVCAPGVACAIGSTWSFQQGVLFGFPWTAVFGYLPALTSIFGTSPSVPLPPGTTPTSSIPYISGFIHEKDVSASVGAMTGRAWQVQPAIGLGTISALPNGLVLDTRLEYMFANSGFAIGPNAVANKGSGMMAHAIFKF